MQSLIAKADWTQCCGSSSERITGCNPARMLAELHAYHMSKGLSATMKFRADPNSSMIRGIDPKTIGKGATSGGMGGI